MSRLSHLLSVPTPEYVPPKPRSTKPDSRMSDWRKFQMQRRNAIGRGIEFLLEFDEWLTWWKDTGHYHERGNKFGQYVMGRKGDKGPYQIGNIECVQAQINSVAPHKGARRSDEIKQRMSEALRASHAKRTHGTK